MRISITEHVFKECISHKPGGSVFLGYLQKAKLNFHDESGSTCSMNIKLEVRKNRAGKLSLAAPSLKVWKNSKGEDVYPRAFSFDDDTYEAIKKAMKQIPEVDVAIKKADAGPKAEARTVAEQVDGLTAEDATTVVALLQRLVTADPGVKLSDLVGTDAEKAAELGIKIG